MNRRAAAIALLMLGAVALAGSSGVFATQTQPSGAATSEHMKEHFTRVHEVEAAVIRGDLDAVREPAEWLAAHDPSTELDKASAAQVSAMRQSARKAAEAKDIGTAANATASMLAACGDCHRAAGANPVPAAAEKPAVGGVVGHMMEHQRAVEQLAEGLIIPSAAHWKQGAEGLKHSPLRASQLPRDPKLTKEVANAESRVHALADQAAQATDQPARVKAYSDVIQTCARCHGLHGRVWGPGVPKSPQPQ